MAVFISVGAILGVIVAYDDAVFVSACVSDALGDLLCSDDGIRPVKVYVDKTDVSLSECDGSRQKPRIRSKSLRRILQVIPSENSEIHIIAGPNGFGYVFVSVTSIVTIISILSIAVGQRGQAQTPGQGQDSGRNANA